jgi:hypothetical protein
MTNKENPRGDDAAGAVAEVAVAEVAARTYSSFVICNSVLAIRYS